MIRLTLGITALTMLYIGLFFPANQEDIQKCYENTNYTIERCKWEITR